MLLGEEVDGREGLKLGPGITFIFTLFLFIIVVYVVRGTSATDIAPQTVNEAKKGIRSAISEGNIWRSVVLFLPFYLMALIIGVVFHLTHKLLKYRSNLAQSISIGLYILSTIIFLTAVIGISVEEFVQNDRDEMLLGLMAIFIPFFIIPWQFFNFSRHAYGHSDGNSAGITLLSFIFLLIVIFIGILIGGTLNS